jgi:hypothetical protein
VGGGPELEEGREIALDGRLLRLAHGVEGELREGGPESAERVLAAARKRNAEWVAELSLERPEGGWSEVASGASVSAPASSPDRQVELSLGRAWGGPMASGGSRGGGWGGTRSPARRALGRLARRRGCGAPSERAGNGALLVGLAVGLTPPRPEVWRERARELEPERRRPKGSAAPVRGSPTSCNPLRRMALPVAG